MKTSTEYIKNKWEREKKTEEWAAMCETQNTTTNSRFWRGFRWKHLTQFFITQKIKSKQTQDNLPCWKSCGNKEAHHTHVFWECLKLHHLWRNVTLVTGDILDYQIPHNLKLYILGTLKSVFCMTICAISKILLIAPKKAITRNWYKLDPPSLKNG